MSSIQEVKSTNASLISNESKQEQNLETIENKFVNNMIRCTDHNDKYYIYHFKDCNNDSPLDVKNRRGVIYYTEDGNPNNGKIVCQTFNYTPEYLSTQKDEIKKVIENIGIQNCHFYNDEESTLLRLWFHNGKWNLSSHKKLSAYASFWSNSKSHGELFEEAIKWQIEHGKLKSIVDTNKYETIMEAYYSTLSSDTIYTFLLRSNEDSRIVCNSPDHPTIYFCSEFDNTNFNLLDSNTSGLDRPTQYNFETIDKLLDFLDNIDPYLTRGLMVYYGEKTNKFGTIKLTNSAYQNLACIRGNTPQLALRYLELRKNSEKLLELVKMFPKHVDMFNKYEKVLHYIAENIYNKYLLRYVLRNQDGLREFVTLPKEQWLVCKLLHDLYLQDPVKYRISQELVQNHIDNMPAWNVNYLIKKELERQASHQTV